MPEVEERFMFSPQNTATGLLRWQLKTYYSLNVRQMETVVFLDVHVSVICLFFSPTHIKGEYFQRTLNRAFQQ